MPANRRPGLTLVELLVVLVILAILTTVAVQSTDMLVDQGRYDATQRTVQGIEEAILGPANQRGADGSLLITGFVADMGRPPRAFGIDPFIQLAELWNNDKDNNGVADLDPFGVKPAVGFDSQVLAPCGWRAPYLRLAPGTQQLRNGWGNSYLFLRADRTPPASGQEIDIVQDLGANNQVDPVTETSYARDTELIFRLVSPPINRYVAPVTGLVRLLDAAGQPRTPAMGTVVRVVLYGPHPNDGKILPFIATATSTGGPAGEYQYTIATHDGTPTGIVATMGPRVVRAYEVPDPVANHWPPMVDLAADTMVRRSRILTQTIPAGGMQLPALDIVEP